MTPTTKFEEALVYAAHLHADQKRKGGVIPYISHLIAVSALVLENGGGEEEAIGALLHDAAEDQGGWPRLEDIRAHFGDAVAAIVEGCSDSLVTDRAQKEEWGVRKRRYIAHLGEASPSVRLVACADKLHNARCTVADLRRDGPGSWGRFDGPVADQLWYYGSLRDEFLRGGPAELAGELERTVAEMERLSR